MTLNDLANRAESVGALGMIVSLVDPQSVRLGLGRTVLALSESAARKADSIAASSWLR